MSAQVDSLRRFVAAHPTPVPPRDDAGGPPVVVVAAGKGGVGTSVVAALVALVDAAEGRRVLLVDGDERVGPLHLLLGRRPAASLLDLRGGAVDAEAALLPVTATLALLPGGPPVASGGAAGADAPLSAAERGQLHRRASALYERHDLVVVDAGSRLESVLAACDAGAARVLLVTSGDAIALAAAYALVKSVDARYPALPLDVLVNREDTAGAAAAFSQLEAGSRHFLDRALAYVGAVPDDRCLQMALAAGMPLPDAAAGSPAAAAAQDAAARIRSALSAPPAGASPRLSQRT